MNALRPGVNKSGEWSGEEVSKLLGVVGEVGEVWKEVCARMPGRTEKQCMKKWKRVTSKQGRGGGEGKGEVKMKEAGGGEVGAVEEQKEPKEQTAQQQRWLYTGYRRRQGNEVTTVQGRGRKRRETDPSAPRPPPKRKRKAAQSSAAEPHADAAAE